MAVPGGMTKLIWHPEALTAKLKGAFPAACRDTKVIADRLNPAPKHIKIRLSSVNVEMGYAFLKGFGGLAHIFEGGRKGGYPIQPGVIKRTRGGVPTVGTSGKRGSQVAIKFVRGDGGFYRGPGFLGGPMGARPFIHPAGVSFPILYRRRASAVMASSVGAGLGI